MSEKWCPTPGDPDGSKFARKVLSQNLENRKMKTILLGARCATTFCFIATIIALNWDKISEHFK